MDQSPGMLLRDGGGEDGEDLLEVQAVVGVEGAGVPHDYQLLGDYHGLTSYSTHLQSGICKKDIRLL